MHSKDSHPTVPIREVRHLQTDSATFMEPRLEAVRRGVALQAAVPYGS